MGLPLPSLHDCSLNRNVKCVCLVLLLKLEDNALLGYLVHTALPLSFWISLPLFSPPMPGSGCFNDEIHCVCVFSHLYCSYIFHQLVYAGCSQQNRAYSFIPQTPSCRKEQYHRTMKHSNIRNCTL